MGPALGHQDHPPDDFRLEEEPKRVLTSPPLLASLFDPPVETAEVDPFVDALDELLPAESNLIGRAAPQRLLEFRAGRHCARAALARLGAAGPVLRAPDRAPIWPDGIVGSIAHTRGQDRALCAAAVAHSLAVRSLGLDVEVEAPLDVKLWRRILREREAAWISKLPVAEQGISAMLVFSAKESVYKCQHALSRTFLEFADVEIDPLDNGLFSAMLLRDALPFEAGHRFSGRYARRRGLIATGVTLPA